MAVQKRVVSGTQSFRVYWRDPITGKHRSKSFKERTTAMAYDANVKDECAQIREASRISRESMTPHMALSELRGDLDLWKAKVRGIFSDPNNPLPDLFDGLMAEVGLPTRFKDVVAAARAKNGKARIPARLRTEILQRDGFGCVWCGRKAPVVALHVDHIIPVSRGGLTEERNLRTLCHECNMGRSDKTRIPPTT